MRLAQIRFLPTYTPSHLRPQPMILWRPFHHNCAVHSQQVRGMTPEHKTDADGLDSFYSFATVLILKKHSLEKMEAVPLFVSL